MANHPLGHAVARMAGRDPGEFHRVATPLELFYDLTFVIAFSVAGAQFAHAIAEGHVAQGLLGFCFAMFAVIWAWVNFSWFASAYDTDDWIFRLVTMLQMVGVLILAMGIEPLFHSLLAGDQVDNRVMVLGYVLMRVCLIFQWLRAAKQDPERRKACLKYASLLAVVQLGWVAIALINATLVPTLIFCAILCTMELMTPVIAERTSLTPWHAHHIAERYQLLAIIALGECLVGAIESLRAIVAVNGWSMDAALLGLGGTATAFAMWWIYFNAPMGEALHLRRHRGFVFGYVHMLLFAAIAASGAGLHVGAYFIEHKSEISAAAAIASIAIPVAIFKATLTGIYLYLAGMKFRGRTVWTFTATIVLILASIALAAAGVPLPVCLLLIPAGLSVSIVADELGGVARREAAMTALKSGGVN